MEQNRTILPLSHGARRSLTLTALLAAGSFATLHTLHATTPAAVETGRAAVSEAAGPYASLATTSVDLAVNALSRHVTRASSPTALRSAFQAYYRFRAANPDEVRKPYLYFVDLGLDNRSKRGYVFDMDALTLVEGPFTVAHGRGSLAARDGVPARFSNASGSNTSSLGIYLAGNTYTFHGKSGGRAYSSVGLRLEGESGRFNSAAMSRGIVAHGAPYVTASAAGRSEGCPAVELDRAERILPLLANGGVVFVYSPNDADWLENDPWM